MGRLHDLARRLIPGLALIGLLASCNSGANMTDASKKDPAYLLDAMLSADTEQQLGEILKLHGSIKDDEVSALAKATSSWSQTKRRNAARLLTLNSSTAANEALRHCVLQTNDLHIWAVALSKLLSQKLDKSLAESRPGLLAKALESEDEPVLAAAIQAGILVQPPKVHDVIARALRSPSLNVHLALEKALHAGAGPFESMLRAQIAIEKDAVFRSILVGILGHSEDQVTWDVLRKTFDRVEDFHARRYMYDALRDHRNPRLVSFLLERAQRPGPDRALALSNLSRLGPSAELVQLCMHIHEEPSIPVDDPKWLEYRYESCLETCDGYLSQLANRKLHGAEAQNFAKTWLSQNSVAKP